MRCLRLIILLFLLLPAGGVAWGAPSSALEEWLVQVDQAIDQREATSGHHLHLIDSVKRLRDGVTNPVDLYAIERQIYSMYRTYDIDSAYSSAQRRLAYARALGDDASRIASASLNLAESYFAIGNFARGMELLDSVPRDAMKPYHSQTLYNLYYRGYSALIFTEGESSRRDYYRRQVDAYLDSLILQYGADDMQWYEYRAHRELHRDNPKKALSIMEEGIRKLGFPEDNPSQLRLLGEIYSQIGDREKSAEYYAMSSLVDLRAARRDYKSLIALADILNDMGEYERSYRYIYVALDDASSSNARARVWEIASSLPIISETYTNQQRAYTSTLKLFVAIIIALAVALALAFVITLKQKRSARRVGRRLDTVNAQLQESNERLVAQNELRIHYISTMLDMHSDFIKRISRFCKSVVREARSGKWDKAMDMLNSPSLEEAERRQLYAHFDDMFLSLFPDFITQVNSMLLEPYRVDEANRCLTPELRVVALKKLGIEEPAKIASILHYNTQTIYNYRSRLKSWLNVSEEEFYSRLCSGN